MTNQPNAAQTPPTLSLANVTDDLAADLHFAIKALSFLVDYDEVEEARAVLEDRQITLEKTLTVLRPLIPAATPQNATLPLETPVATDPNLTGHATRVRANDEGPLEYLLALLRDEANYYEQGSLRAVTGSSSYMIDRAKSVAYSHAASVLQRAMHELANRPPAENGLSFAIRHITELRDQLRARRDRMNEPSRVVTPAYWTLEHEGRLGAYHEVLGVLQRIYIETTPVQPINFAPLLHVLDAMRSNEQSARSNLRMNYYENDRGSAATGIRERIRVWETCINLLTHGLEQVGAIQAAMINPDPLLTDNDLQSLQTGITAPRPTPERPQHPRRPPLPAYSEEGFDRIVNSGQPISFEMLLSAYKTGRRIFSDAIIRADYDGFKWYYSEDLALFEYCNFKRTRFIGNYARVMFRHCDFNGAKWERTALYDVDFTNCEFRNVTIIDNNLHNVDFHGSNDIVVVYAPDMSSRDRPLYAIQHDDGIMVSAGCFWNTLEVFKNKVTSDKGDDHLYLDAAAFIEKALG